MLKKGKKLLSLLLCAVLMAGLVTMPVYAVEEHDHDHDHDHAACGCDHDCGCICDHDCAAGCDAGCDCACASGSVNTGIVTLAAAVTPLAAGETECPSSPDGKHLFVKENEGKPGTTCPGVIVYQVTCKYCGEPRGYTADAHDWSNWTETPATCTSAGSRTRHCTRCDATDSEIIPTIPHQYKTVTIAATATNCSLTYRQCTVCNQTDGTTTPDTHSWVKTSNDCTVAATCSKCGAKDTWNATQVMHKFGGEYIVTAEGHYQKCTNSGCQVTSAVTAHTAQSVSGDCTKGTTCSVCGYVGLTGQQHNFASWVVGYNASTHEIRCSNPGCTVTQRVSHTPGESTSCTAGTQCTVCGYTLSAGKGHTFGAIQQGDGLGHTRTCSACGYVEKSSHTGSNDDGDCTTPVKCTTCGYVVTEGYAGHDYSRTVWISDGANGHYTLCSHPGCLSKQTGAHTGGTATCASGAICSVCGGSYGAKNAGNHTGGTEIRNAKPAAVGAEGYTGDTYCLGCNQKLASGSAIPALTADHTHSYATAWSSDSTSHWHECSCGDRKDVAAHTFVDGQCTVCGEEDPNYREAEEHVHTYSTVWSGDSQEHWHECTICGHQADRDTHRFLNGICIECGMEFVKEEEKPAEPTPAPVTTFTDVKAESYYADAVSWAVAHGITAGTGGNNFSPDANCTRAQIVTFLWRANGSPEPVSTDSHFKDVSESDYYYQAVLWAVENGITGGTGGNSFSPDDTCTRAQAVTFMYRAAGEPDVSKSGGFGDVKADSYYADAVAWAVANGITAGTGGNNFSPEDDCTRAQIVTFLYRDLVG